MPKTLLDEREFESSTSRYSGRTAKKSFVVFSHRGDYVLAVVKSGTTTALYELEQLVKSGDVVEKTPIIVGRRIEAGDTAHPRAMVLEIENDARVSDRIAGLIKHCGL